MTEKKRRQIQVSPSAKEAEVIHRLARFWEESDAGIVMRGFRKAMPEMLSEMEQVDRMDLSVADADVDEITEARAAEFLKALTAKRKPSALEVQQTADALGVPSESLAELVRECCCETEEKKTHAKSKN